MAASLLAVFPQVDTEDALDSLPPLIRTRILWWGSALMTSSKPSHLPKAPSLHAIPLGGRLQRLNRGGGDTSIDSRVTQPAAWAERQGCRLGSRGLRDNPGERRWWPW